jgi:uncharacterized protein (TIGR02757 family)
MKTKTDHRLKDFFDEKVLLYNRASFIKDDPICIPHSFTKKQNIEIAGLFAAVFAWGNRTTIINKSKELMALMDWAPYDFCLNHQPGDLKKLEAFKHRTFNATDLLYFIEFFKQHYTSHKSLEEAFTKKIGLKQKNSPPSQGGDDIIAAGNNIRGGVEQALINFHNHFFSLNHIPHRTKKHIATPQKGSTCKRLNMFLRWMVRNDTTGVDFGIWKKIKPADLICPIDVHVARVAKKLGLLTRKQVDWQAAVELTNFLRTLDPLDPVKYDFALFGLGVMEKY